MIIDSHTHTFPEKIAAKTIAKLSGAAHLTPFTEATVPALLVSMQEAGIDISLNMPVATSEHQVPKLNDAAAVINEAGLAAKDGPRVLSFGCMHPDYGDWYAELGRVKELGLRGIKIHPPYQGVDLDDIRYVRICERAAQLGLVVLTHTGLDVGLPGADRATPAMGRRLVREVGDFPLILAHMGGWRYWEEVPEQLADTCVYLDTAFSEGRLSPIDDYRTGEELQMLTQEAFVGIVRAFGADRILFGTDSPWADQKSSVEHMAAMPLTDAEKEAIFCGTAKKVLGL